MNNQNRPPPPYNQHNPANQYNLQHNIPNQHPNQHMNLNQQNIPRYPQHHQQGRLQHPPHHQQRPPHQMQRYILPQGNAPMYYNQPVYFYNQSFNRYPGQQIMQMNVPYRPPIINNALPPVPIVNNALPPVPIVNNPTISVNSPSSVNGVATSVMSNDQSKTAKDKSADQSRKDDENSNDESEESNRKKRKKKSERPWRGYVVEEEGTSRKFTTVGHETCYVQDESTSEVSVTDNLLKLHLKFIKHHLLFNDGTTQDKETIHDSVPHNNSTNEDNECECNEEQKSYGVHHDKFMDDQYYPLCDPYKSNAGNLHHYRLIIVPETNFVTRDPTTIYFDGKDFCFEGYSLFSHESLDHVPGYTFMRHNIDYKVEIRKEKYIPKGFCIKDLDLVCDYLFLDVMELFDWNFKEAEDRKGCRPFHFMPRFVHKLSDLTSATNEDISEILSMAEVLEHFIESVQAFAEPDQINDYTSEEWRDFAKGSFGCLVLNPKKKPRAIRVDSVARPKAGKVAVFNHSTSSSKILSKESRKQFSDLTDQLNKAKRAVNSRAVPRREDQELLWNLQNEFNWFKEERAASKFTEVEISCKEYLDIGLRWDICQHASYLPGLFKYLKFMLSLCTLEKEIKYTFKDKSLLKTALTHPSHADQGSLTTHISNTIQNLGKRYPHIEKKIRPESLGPRKKGMSNVTNIMTTLLDSSPEKSSCLHNERLEFLGDSILDYICSLHLFLMFPLKTPGELTAFRSGLVQTSNLLKIGKEINLHKYLLIHHRFAIKVFFENYIANAVESLIGAIYLDSGLKAVDDFICYVLFPVDDDLSKIWKNVKAHPIQEEQPDGDRHILDTSKDLKKFVELEKAVGITFKHIRLLVKAFTHSGLDNMKLVNGDYQRLEYFGDAILKFISSDYLYKHFPQHQEGHLTLLRSSLVNSRTLAAATTDLDFLNYIRSQAEMPAHSVKEKVASDIFESFLGAVHTDKGIRHCKAVVDICIFSRLKEFIINQEWLDPKSQLSQCFDTLHEIRKHPNDNPQPLHPKYKRLKQRMHGGVHYFKVGVYYKEKRLGTGEGRSLKEAEKEAARDALRNNYFEQHARQKKIIYRKFGPRRANEDTEDVARNSPVPSNPRKRHASETSQGSDSYQRFSPARQTYESDDGAETLGSSEGEQETGNDGELYESVFNMN